MSESPSRTSHRETQRRQLQPGDLFATANEVTYVGVTAVTTELTVPVFPINVGRGELVMYVGTLPNPRQAPTNAFDNSTYRVYLAGGRLAFSFTDWTSKWTPVREA